LGADSEPEAIGFGYFETLIKTGSKARVDAEKERMQALNAYIETAGGVPAYVFQDFADETSSLLEKMSEMIGNPERAAEDLLEAFNTPDVSNSIMYHFRLMASAYLKGHRDTYGDFISTGTGVDGYCQAVLERHGVEIDHLGLELLVNVLLKPIDFVLEVAYLDRSPGSEVNIYRFPKEANSQLASDLGPTIHLLYRPDHYDILYPPEPVSLQVHRVTSLSQSYEIASTPAALHSYAQLNLQPLAFIPGFDASPAGLAPILDTTSASPLTTYSPSPVSPWVSAPFPDPALQATSASMAIPPPAPPLQPQTHPLRFSEYCQLPEYVENNTRREPTFQTATFKNSHFNVAHYNNPNFQPEEYKPEADDHDSPPRGGGRKRGSV
jgi:ubiquitin thioesterase protein OTUB1